MESDFLGDLIVDGKGNIKTDLTEINCSYGKCVEITQYKVKIHDLIGSEIIC